MLVGMWSTIWAGMLVSASSGYVLESRQDTREACTGGDYTTPIGLGFNVTCGYNIGMGHDITSAAGDNITDCMQKCSEFMPLPGQSPCRAVVFASETNWCWYKDRNWTDTDIYLQDVSDMAVADRSELQSLDTSCPFPSGSIQKTANGQSFKISCGYDSETDEFDRTGDTYYQAHHSETLEDCMTWCSDGNPTCYGVVFNADLERGYRNCYPKSANTSDNLVKSQWVMHTATLLNTTVVEDTSSSGTTNSTTNNDNTDTSSANSNAATENSSSKSSSKAWIAGVVVGPLALIALLVGVFMVWRKRNNQKKQQQQQTHYAEAPDYYPPPKEPISSTDEVPAYSEAEAKPPRNELDATVHNYDGRYGTVRPHEMP